MGFTVVLQASRTCNQMKACLNLLLQFSIVWIIDELHCRWKDLHLMLIHGFNQGQVATQRLTIKYVLATLRPQADCARLKCPYFASMIGHWYSVCSMQRKQSSQASPTS
ncbi:uncharacterized protein LOC112496119 isoform X4 [Citrus sinensis]|uniref:uncharacterized protein LOC112496119 isoform X4 n=1 Tax=Citrus sinensis TaxID=2711 RepID=UPI002277B0AD|nr:uncharacterized protein LOC112496119 isoform X4 [Citrus sinensis]XP_052299250.1 uncharacterized protein LOC112496119 isoform X4 [Citrus sinensis]